MKKTPMKKKKRNKDYWVKRFAQRENQDYESAEKFYREIQEQFRMAKNSVQMDIEYWYNRLAENNDISYAAAKKMLKKDELEEFHWTVEQYIKRGEESGLNGKWIKQLENASARVHISRLEAMKIQMGQHMEKLFADYEGRTEDFLSELYQDDYYRSAWEISKGIGQGFDLHRIDTRKIDTLLKKPWALDGANFSDRIWTNKDKLLQNLNTELSQCIIRGASPQEAIKNLAHKMDVSQSQAGNLIMTEMAAVSSRAQQDCFTELGIERFEIVATLDSHTSDICQEMDGKSFDMKEYEVGVTAPPFHPRCRTTTVPYFDDEFTIGEERAARDPETGRTVYVDGDLTYPEWKKRYVEGGEKGTEPIVKKPNSDIIELTDAEQLALNQYVSFDFYPINEKLRNGVTLTQLESHMVEQLDSALQKMPLYNGNLSRSLYFRGEEDAVREFLKGFSVGEEIYFDEFLSTTCGDELYNPDGEIQIYIENSSRGRDITSINSAEKEILYERKSKFKVLNVTEHAGKYWILLEES